MLRRAIALTALLTFLPLAVQAQAIPVPIGMTPCLITTATATVCKNSAGTLLGFANNSLSAQTVTVTCFANAAGAASGSQVANVGALGIGQIVTYPGIGKSYPLGLVCQASGVPVTSGTGTGIEVYSN